MKQKLRRLSMILLLVLALTVSALAAQYSDIDSFDKLETAFADNSGDTEIHITLSGDINFAGVLFAQEGKTFYIDGKAYTLKDVFLSGAGTVNVDVKSIETPHNSAAIAAGGDVTVNITADIKSEGAGVGAMDNAALTVNGSIESSEVGAVALGNSEITVNGDITTKNDGVVAADASSVTVNGSVDASSGGVIANDSASAAVNGSVTSGTDGISANKSAEITVSGDVTAGGNGISARDDSTVMVDGNVTSVNNSAPAEDGSLLGSNINTDPNLYSDGHDGIYAVDNANVTVSGDVTGGNAYGSWGYAGDGIYAEDTATVSVGGNVTGGDVIANPDLETPHNSAAGSGVNMDATANVTVGGDAIGGSTNGKNGSGGSGAFIYLTLVPADDEETKAGSLSVGGTARGGETLDKENGKNGAGIQFAENAQYGEDGELVIPDNTKQLTPEITVHAVEGPDGLLFSAIDADLEQKLDGEAAKLSTDVNYTIWVKQDAGVTIKVDKETAKAGETVTVSAAANDGFILRGVYVSGRELKAENGVYSFVVPEGGDVMVSAEYDAIPKEDVKPDDGKDSNAPEIKPDSTQKAALTPQTGDNSNVWLYAGVAIVALLVLGVLLFMTIRSKKHGKK